MLKKSKLKKHLKKENAKWPSKLKHMPKEDWPKGFNPEFIKEIWRSRNYLVQIYDVLDGKYERISVCRTMINSDGWVDKIPWDDLQRLKDECGRGDKSAVELYPKNDLVVNVASMRHLFIVPGVPEFCWQPKAED